MGSIPAAAPPPTVRIAGKPPGRAHAGTGTQTPARAVQVLAALGLVGILTTLLMVAAGAASTPTEYVPARSGGWPTWLAGPLRGLDLGLHGGTFQTLMLIMCASYALVLSGAHRLPMRLLAGTIVGANAILLLGPPLISQDVFGYLAFARLGALHGLDPYTHVPAEAPTDAVFHFIGWPFQNSPYGPLFTLLGYAIAPLGLAGGLWAFKAIAVVSSLAAVALIARAATRLGRSAKWAIAFVGLNPVMLVLAVGGAHNDTLLVLALATALSLTAATVDTGRAGSHPRAGAGALVAGVGIKLTAGLALPFLILSPPNTRERVRVALGAGAAILALAVVAVIGFGVHALGFLGAIGEQQQLVSTHSIPAETARLAGLSGTPGWWRDLFAAGFLTVVVYQLWRTASGADWRVATGWSTLALLTSTAWVLPWYAIWVLPLAAVSGNRRLCAAALLACAYAVLIHLTLADALLNPHIHNTLAHVHLRLPGMRHRLKFAGFQVLRDVHVDLRW